MKPRIYVYKITFVDQPYWYWGWHKEKKYDEYYMGSPKTNKRYWDLYEPIKEIVQVFEYSEEGALLAQKAEQALIKPDLDNPSCLNEHCAGIFSIKAVSEGLKKKWQDPEFKEKVVFSKNTPESRKKVSDSLKLKWQDPDYWAKMSEISKARWESSEHKEKVSKSISETMKDPEYKEKISKVRRERWKDEEYRNKVVNSQKEIFARNGHQQGEKNSAFGTMWITDGTKEGSRRIPKGSPIPEGFRPGRVVHKDQRESSL